MRCLRWGILAIFLGTAPVAGQNITAADVPTDAVFAQLSGCIRDSRDDAAALACFDAAGVPEGARRLAVASAEAGDLIPILEGFHETGRVDVAEVYYPWLANTNSQMMLVNTRAGPRPATGLAFSRIPADTSGTRAVLSRHPQAFASGRVAILAARNLPGGLQRFVLGDIVTDGCRACAVVASSLVYVDFRDGALAGVTDLGWSAWADATEGSIAAALGRGDIAMLQTRLNAFGYDAGPVDGAAGPRTMAAFFDFKRDHCLPEDRRISRELVAILSRPPGFDPAPCGPGATGVGATVSLPLRSGTYAADARLCPPAPLSVRAEFGDRAYGLVVDIDGDGWAWGESICTIRNATPQGADLALDLDCMAEGRPQRSQVMLNAVGEDVFAFRGRNFALCQPPADSLPVRPGTYAHDIRLCPGSTETPPDNVVFEAGARPLSIGEGTFAWDHAICEVSAVRAAGDTHAVDLSCHAENTEFDTSVLVHVASETSVFFDGFTRTWCVPPPTAEVTDLAADPAALPVVEGVYAFHPVGCPEFDDFERIDRELAGADLRVTLIDGQFTQGDQVCPIAAYSESAGQGMLEMDCLYGDTPVRYRFEMTPEGNRAFRRYDDLYELCPGTTPDHAAGPDDRTVFPLPAGAWRLTANYGAHGADDGGTETYRAGQYHTATDFAAIPGTLVRAPADGEIVYYHRLGNRSPEPNWGQSFFVLRDRQGRDWIIAHVDCTVCGDHPPIGDSGTWPASQIVRDIEAGDPIGVIADQTLEGGANHLHLGLVTQPVTENGQLRASFRGGNWARIQFSTVEADGWADAAAAAAGLGFVDPMTVLPPD